MRNIQTFGLLAVILHLGGCAIAPGMHMQDSAGGSTVSVPVRSSDGEYTQEKLSIHEITGELIVEQEALLYPQLTGSASPEQPEYQYHIGPGDVLNITVWDHPELTIPAGQFRDAKTAGTLVGPDGTIFYPYAGKIDVKGLTVEEIRDALTKKLSHFIENIQLDVRVADYRSQRVYVVGEVNNPGIYPVTDVPMTALEAINRAGGFTVDSDRRQLTLTRQGETYRVDMLALYENGDASRNLLLQHGNVLYVPDRINNKIFVLGEVRNPSSYLMNKGRKTLAEALADAGGVDQNSSNPARVYVIRGSDTPKVFHLNASSPDALILADRFPLFPHDVVYVDTAEVVRWNRVMSQILPTIKILEMASRTDFPLFQGNGN
ncbi:MAG: polysaccharide biosynthesis/export family protein [gamma proteobacterium endosymbiont of Lamellibrachia anaximandri]|nr:polysaccharide biosynthesis/export family protein [gamma proteobacterium endosymbiont of Lamellibrachia anaximandri]MBL3617904.1 polysaccharide biosynthesis/export family protein [gamma proteobacterium endosymbiont of Lamellibrachia anaximandri]